MKMDHFRISFAEFFLFFYIQKELLRSDWEKSAAWLNKD